MSDICSLCDKQLPRGQSCSVVALQRLHFFDPEIFASPLVLVQKSDLLSCLFSSTLGYVSCFSRSIGNLLSPAATDLHHRFVEANPIRLQHGAVLARRRHDVSQVLQHLRRARTPGTQGTHSLPGPQPRGLLHGQGRVGRRQDRSKE